MNVTRRKQLILPDPMRSDWLVQQETHAGLWLDRYIQNPKQQETEARKQLLSEAASIQLSAAYHQFYARWEQSLKAYQAQCHVAEARGRLIVGLGDESVLETSIALHHTYGVPYLPGTALKGLAASYAHQRLQGEWKKGGTLHNVVFGRTDEAGYIIFFDALYIPASRDKQILYPDVITVHHPRYYRGDGQVPADWDSPTPITYLSTTGTYLVALAAPDLEDKETWLLAALRILALALSHMGIGAKTSSGYGRMDLRLPEPIDPLAEAQQEPVEDPELLSARQNIERLYKVPVKNFSSEIPQFYQKWQHFSSLEARLLLAEAIVTRVDQIGKKKDFVGKRWYQDVAQFLEVTEK